MKKLRPKANLSRRIIKLKASDVTEVINALSFVVVSLDRLGSRYYDDPEGLVRETGKFFKPAVFKKLARARGILSTAYASQSTLAQQLRAEATAERLPYWKSSE